jgi:hypothetical protein
MSVVVSTHTFETWNIIVWLGITDMLAQGRASYSHHKVEYHSIIPSFSLTMAFI